METKPLLESNKCMESSDINVEYTMVEKILGIYTVAPVLIILAIIVLWKQYKKKKENL